MGNNIIKGKVSSLQKLNVKGGVALKMVIALASITPVTGVGADRKYGEKAAFDGTVLVQEIVWSNDMSMKLLDEGIGQGALVSIEALGVEALSQEHEMFQELADEVAQLDKDDRPEYIRNSLTDEKRNAYYNAFTASGQAKRKFSGARFNTLKVDEPAPRVDASIALKPTKVKTEA